MTNTVRHVGYGILLNLSLDDLGHPDRPGLWEEIYRPRPFTEVLRCPEPVGAGFCPEVMYVQVREGLRVAVHRNKDVANHARTAESDLHQALKDRVAESAVAAGLSVEVESSAGDRARVTDVLVSGHTGRRIGWEIQLAGIAPRKVLERSSVASRDRITPLWTVTRVNAAPINRAPWARLPVMDDWRMAGDRHLAVQGGVRKLVMRPCELPCSPRAPRAREPCAGKSTPHLRRSRWNWTT